MVRAPTAISEFHVRIFSPAASTLAVFGAVGLTAGSAPGLAVEHAANSTLTATAVASAPATADLPVVSPDAPLEESGDPALRQSAPEENARQPKPAAGFASLSDAVAAQAAPGSGSTELDCLADAVFHEANGEPLAGQLAVAQVILNRVASGRFADTVCGVIRQPGQFTFARAGHGAAAHHGSAAFKTAMAVAQVAMNDAWQQAAPRALYFHARRLQPGWRLTKVAAIGNHVFYR